MRLIKLIVTLGVGVTLLASCAAPSIAPALGPTLATIPEEILASHFGICSVDQDIDGITELGIRWTKPYANPFGPFIWGFIESEKGKYA